MRQHCVAIEQELAAVRIEEEKAQTEGNAWESALT